LVGSDTLHALATLANVARPFDVFNVIDMNNFKSQGGFSFEGTWKTHLWWVSDFQMLFGMSEVNAFLLFRHFKPRQKNARQHDFGSRLTYQMHDHPWVD
jgi:hypothetical protein